MQIGKLNWTMTMLWSRDRQNAFRIRSASVEQTVMFPMIWSMRHYCNVKSNATIGNKTNLADVLVNFSYFYFFCLQWPILKSSAVFQPTPQLIYDFRVCVSVSKSVSIFASVCLSSPLGRVCSNDIDKGTTKYHEYSQDYTVSANVNKFTAMHAVDL